MNHITKFVGLDVSKASISVAVADREGGGARYWGEIANTPEAVGKLMKRLGKAEELFVCYEAGPTGYGLFRQLTGMGIRCIVVAPSLTPLRPGDRVKTDRKDSLRLAQLLRAGELTPVWVPDETHEALRDLVRAREDAKQDQLRARHRLSKFLLRHDVRPPEKMRPWSKMYMRWLDTVKFELMAQQITFQEYLHAVTEAAGRIERLDAEIHEQATASPHAPVIQALQAMRGIAEVSAVTMVAEVGKFSRFRSPRPLMGYGGMTPSEYSSGASRHQGSITKTGNAHLRRVLVEAAWAYRHRPAVRGNLRTRQQGADPEVKAIAIKAQERLQRKFCRLTFRGKPSPVAMTAIARELLGFAWAIARHVEESTERLAA